MTFYILWFLYFRIASNLFITQRSLLMNGMWRTRRYVADAPLTLRGGTATEDVSFNRLDFKCRVSDKLV